jgi:hypothetical protein
MFFSKLAIPLAFAASALAQTFSINTPVRLERILPSFHSTILRDLAMDEPSIDRHGYLGGHR